MEDEDIVRDDYVVNVDETKILFLHIIERAILDFKNLSKTKSNVEQESYQSAKAFLFDDTYKIYWGDYDITLNQILAYLNVDDEWFQRKLEEMLNDEY